MSTPKLPSFYLSLSQVRDSGLLTPERLSQIEEQIEDRLSMPYDDKGHPIGSARLADLSPYGRFLFVRMDHEVDEGEWAYAKRQILCAVLTEEERKLLNANAFRATSRAREDAQFAAAKKVHETEWSSWVSYGDQCYPSTEDLHEHLLCNDTPPEDYPTYCWGTRKQQVIGGLDVERVVEHSIEARGWEDMDLDDLNGVPELRAALEAFEEANTSVVSYTEDRSIAVLLERPTD